MPRALFPLAPLACALLLCGCGGAAPEETATDEAAATATTYLDAVEFFNAAGGNQLERWWSLGQQLEKDFDQVCGDTFCEGDYSNLRPLSLRCAVTSKTGKIKSCQYVFAGSYELVDARTGAITVNAKTFNCKVPATGTVKALVDGLLATGTQPALQRPLPGSTQSIYDSLAGCL